MFKRGSSGENWNGWAMRGLTKMHSIHVWKFQRINLRHFKIQISDYGKMHVEIRKTCWLTNFREGNRETGAPSMRGVELLRLH